MKILQPVSSCALLQPVSVGLSHFGAPAIGVGFSHKFPQTCPKKTPQKTTSKKTRLHFFSCWAHFLNQRTLQAPFLPKFSPNFPTFPLTCPKYKLDLQIKTSALSFWVPFLWNQSTCRDFANVFTNFAQISTDFARIFNNLPELSSSQKF